MGIQGLLPLIQPAIETRHISYFRGKRLAIDGYAWLHKGMYSCCEDLAMGKENYSWIKYCLKYVDMLLSFQVCLTMVFDGSNLPQKMATEKTRKEKRRLSLEKGLQLKQDGDHGGARNHFTTSVDVTPFMAAQLIDVLKRHRPKVDCIVAPYEADAQLAYLTLNGFVDAVVSEDSDTIPFGCSEVIFKLDLQGNCQHLVHKDLFTKTLDSKFDLSTFTQSMLTTMCIASGCDYLDSCRGMGLKNALKHVLKNRSVVPLLRALRLQGIIPLVSAIPKAPLLNSSTSTSSSSADMDNMMHTSHPLCFIVADGKLAPATSLQQYELLFYKAYLTFQHQTVYDPKSCKVMIL